MNDDTARSIAKDAVDDLFKFVFGALVVICAAATVLGIVVVMIQTDCETRTTKAITEHMKLMHK